MIAEEAQRTFMELWELLRSAASLSEAQLDKQREGTDFELYNAAGFLNLVGWDFHVCWSVGDKASLSF